MGKDFTLAATLDFDLLLRDLDSVGQVVEIDLTTLPPAAALRQFRDDVADRINQRRRAHGIAHRCALCGSQRRDATDEERFELDESPLRPREDQVVLVYYREDLVGSYYPGDPARPRKYRHHVVGRQRRFLPELLQQWPGARPFYATARPVCPFTFDWAAVEGLITLSAGAPTKYQLAAEYIRREEAAGAKLSITRSDLVDFFLARSTHKIYRRHHDRTILHQLEALSAALETEAFDDLRAELTALPTDAFAYQAPVD